ncbi:hypothetical protein ABBQ38_003697 [Trebouxia sp. C0009 RCD-2024]
MLQLGHPHSTPGVWCIYNMFMSVARLPVVSNRGHANRSKGRPSRPPLCCFSPSLSRETLRGVSCSTDFASHLTTASSFRLQPTAGQAM